MITAKDIVKTPSESAGYTVLSQKVLLTRDNGHATTATAVTTLPTSAKFSYYLTNTDESIGFRFDNILVKSPSTAGITSSDKGIKSATFNFTTSSNYGGSITLYVDPDVQSKYLRTDINSDLQKRTVDTGSVICDVPIGTNKQVKCDVTELVRRQVGLADWYNGNAITFIAKRNVNGVSMNFTTAIAKYRPSLDIEADNRLIANNEKTVASKLLETALGLAIGGATNTVDSMFEASKYISNIPGNSGKGPYHDNKTTTSPILENCQLTHLVIMSDGAATGSIGNGPAIYMNGSTAAGCKIFTSDDKSTSIPDPYINGEMCGRAFASWMARTSHSNDDANFIRSHTIGFNLEAGSSARKFLEEVATHGMGKYYDAAQASDLIDAFQDIIENALSTSRPSAGGAVVLGAENRYEQRTEVFYGLYKTSTYDYWFGNVKGFKLDYVDHQLTTGKDVKRPVLHAWNNNAAVINTDGSFIEGRSSAWSSNDSADITKGGVVNQLPTPANRKLYTLKSNRESISSGIPLISSATDITTADLGLAASEDERRKGLLDFIRGYSYIKGGTTNPDDALTPKIGESGNNGITLVSYGCSVASETQLTCDFNHLDLVGLQATNDGFFRGYNLKNGKALYEFMPQQMLPVISKLQKGRGLNKDTVKTYGLDGQVVIAHDDINSNGIIDADEKAFAIVKGGRGGPYLYGFDISVANRNDPKLIWTIDATGDFDKLGDTWSLPVTGRVAINRLSSYQVLIMGGGYDKSNDTTASKHTNTKGNALYVIDAATGMKIWSTSAHMDYSIPGQVATLTDKDKNFITDVIFGDMGGQIWHFKVKNGSSANKLLKAAGDNNGIIASISGSSETDTRRFYQTPVLYKISDTVVSVNIGSGYKAHPLVDNNNDRFYSFRVPLEGSKSVLTENDLAIADPFSSSSLANNNKGFMVKLGNGTQAKGEKIINNAFADRNRLIFSSFIPSVGVVKKQCMVNTVGTQRTYYFNLKTGGSLLKSGYTESYPSTLPLDPVVYCGGGSCTVISSMDMLAEHSDNVVDPSIFPQLEQSIIVKRSWTDLFDPLGE